MQNIQGSSLEAAGGFPKQTVKKMSLWLPLGVQLAAGLLVVAGLIAWGVPRLTWVSASWGVLACVLPASLCVAGYQISARMMQEAGKAQAFWGLVLILFWELMKLLLSVALLLLAPRLIADVSWVAMLITFIVVVKAYWLTFVIGWLRKPRLKQSVLKTSV